MEVNEKAPSTSPPLSLTSQRTSVTTMMGDTIVNSSIVKVSSSSSERGEGRTTSSSSSSSMNTSDNQIHRSPYGKNYNDSRHYHNEMKVEHECPSSGSTSSNINMMQEEPAARNNSHDVFRLRQERRVGQGDDERIQYLYERHPSNVHSPSSPHYQRLKKARTLYSDDLHPYHENYYSPHDEGHGYHNPHPGFSHSSAGDPATTYSNNSSRIKSGHLRHSAYTHSISYNQDGAYYQSYQHQDQHPRYHSSTPDRYVVRPVASPPRPPPPEESSGDVRSGNRGKPRDNATEDYQTQQYLSSPLSFGSPCHTHNDDHRLGHHSDTFPSTTTSAFHGSADHQNLSHHPPPHIMTPSPFHQQPPPPPPPYLPHLAAGATTAYPPLDGSMYPGGDGYLAYAYPPPPAPYPYSPSRFVLHHPVQPPPYLQRVEYITKIKKSDILSGRGGATNSHSGNRAFRSMVKEYQEQYAKAKKKDKPSVAAMLVDKIRESGGRFLRRIETTTPDGQVLWVDIGDERAREKTCQALREGAPMRRKKRKAPATSSSGMSNDEDDIDYTSKNSDTGLVTSSSSFADQSSSPRGDCRDGTANMHHTSSWSTSSRMHQQDQHRFASFKGRDNVHPEGRENSDAAAPGDRHQTINQMEESQPSMIRPSPKPILHRQHLPYQSISVDQLEGDQRDLYLRDFLPPDPSIRSNTMKSHFIYPAPTHQSMHETSGPPPPSSARDTAENDQFPVVKV